MGCFNTITIKRAARAEVPRRAASEWTSGPDGGLYRRATNAELRGAFKGLRAARSPSSQRAARAKAQAAARGARQPRPQAIAKTARTGAPASTSSSGEGSSSSGDEGSSGSEDDSSSDEPAVARCEQILVGGDS